MRCPVITEFGTVCHKNPLIVSPWLCTAWLSCRPGPDFPKNIPSIAQLTVRIFSISDTRSADDASIARVCRVEFPCPFYDYLFCSICALRKMSRAGLRLRNNLIATKLRRSVVIAIFAEHSTHLSDTTILF